MFHSTPEPGRQDFAVPAGGRLSLWRWVAPFLVAALGLRLIPLASGGVPEPTSPTGAATPGEQTGQTFPGSAYFFAEGAFAPDAGPTDRAWRDNKHILPIAIGPPAMPYRFAGRTALDRVRALSCLTSAIYYEAANEPEEGQRAVAQVVLNRLRHPDWPNTVCGVVYQGTERDDLRCQFSFSCDGSMARTPTGQKWAIARRVAARALAGEAFAPAGLATYYHTLTVFPAWATQMQPSAIIGAHIFYRTPGAGGLPGRFADRYDGTEKVGGPGIHAYLDPRDAPLPALLPAMPASAPAVAPSAPPPPTTAVSLPESGVKPEFANSGRALN